MIEPKPATPAEGTSTGTNTGGKASGRKRRFGGTEAQIRIRLSRVPSKYRPVVCARLVEDTSLRTASAPWSAEPAGGIPAARTMVVSRWVPGWRQLAVSLPTACWSAPAARATPLA